MTGEFHSHRRTIFVEGRQNHVKGIFRSFSGSPVRSSAPIPPWRDGAKEQPVFVKKKGSLPDKYF